MKFIKLTLLFHLVFGIQLLQAQFIKPDSLYTKTETMIPMRDGTRLFTAIYAPKDKSRNYPILLNRTPYGVGPYGENQFPRYLRPSDAFAQSGYIFVFQDVRGKFMSEGEFENMRPMKSVSNAKIDESTDTWDCIDWCIKNIPNNNGKVGQWGISYPGFYTAVGMINAHPALKASSPQAPIVDWYTGDDFHHNGVLFVPHFFGFFSSFGQARPSPTKDWAKGFQFPGKDGYDFYLNQVKSMKYVDSFYQGKIAFWKDISAHETYDSFWKNRNLRPHLKQIKPAILTVGGWFDAENLYGALQVHKTIEGQSPKTNNRLVMGPWYHGGWNRALGSHLGNMNFGSATSRYYQDSIEFPFFEYHLKGKGKENKTKATVFETGSNQWKTYAQWPPKSQSISYYLNPGAQLSQTQQGQGFDSYWSDPTKPVPYMEEIDNGMSREYMVSNQKFASRRPDVLCYQGQVLENDLLVSGPIEVELWVSADVSDADFVVKVLDQQPENMPNDTLDKRVVNNSGAQLLIRGDIFRAKYRNSLEQAEPLTPGKEPVKIHFHLNDINHRFLKGHRLVIQVQSTWFPLAERNPQQFMNIFEATEKDFVPGFIRIHQGSKIVLPVVNP
ncbi:MAG: CocE/NonD family hydrolase [Bacteroidia bacterium]|nr:CocE/NonD family hydrolase [Bacteroidia bacterium]